MQHDCQAGSQVTEILNRIEMLSSRQNVRSNVEDAINSSNLFHNLADYIGEALLSSVYDDDDDDDDDDADSTIVFMVLSSFVSLWQSYCKSSSGSFDECGLRIANPQAKPTNLDDESAGKDC